MSADKPHRSSDEIARDIVSTRVRLSRTLAVIDGEYALRNLFVHGVRLAGEGKGSPAVADVLKRNAVPLSLVGIGVAWMAFCDQGDDILRLFKGAVDGVWHMLETPHGHPAKKTTVRRD